MTHYRSCCQACVAEAPRLCREADEIFRRQNAAGPTVGHRRTATSRLPDALRSLRHTEAPASVSRAATPKRQQTAAEDACSNRSLSSLRVRPHQAFPCVLVPADRVVYCVCWHPHRPRRCYCYLLSAHVCERLRISRLSPPSIVKGTPWTGARLQQSRAGFTPKLRRSAEARDPSRKWRRPRSRACCFHRGWPTR